MADLNDLVARAGGHQQHLGVLADHTVEHAHQHDDAAVVVILTVKDQRLERRVRVAPRGRYVFDDIVEDRVDVQPQLGADFRRVLGRDADDLLHLVLGPLRVGGGPVDLVDDRQDLQIVVQRQIGV